MQAYSPFHFPLITAAGVLPFTRCCSIISDCHSLHFVEMSQLTQYSCNTCFTTHKAGVIDSLVYDKAGTVYFPLIEHRCIGTPLTQFEFSYTTQVSWGVTQKVLFYDHDTSAMDPQSRCNGSTIGVQSIHNKGAIILQYR